MDRVAERHIYANTARTTEVRMTTMAEQHVFIVDRELESLQVVAKTLMGLGVEVTCFVHPTRCLERLPSRRCDLLTADLTKPEMDGIELVTKAKRVAPWVPVVAITRLGDVSSACRAL
jgi:DNA-binding NtrC family response regulator